MSIIVPVLDEADRIVETLRRLGRDFPGCELIVVDGGSADGTAELVGAPARLVRSRPGRGPQLAAGAAASRGEVLWVQHADIEVEPAALGQIRVALADPQVLGGGLTLRFDRRTPALDYLAATSNARARRLHWIFGDQAMFVRRCALEAVGGFPDLPIMEDLELSRRLARAGRLVVLSATSTASARRLTEHGVLRMLVFMQWLKLRYLTGADPAALAARYCLGPPRLPRRRRRWRTSGSGSTGCPGAGDTPRSCSRSARALRLVRGAAVPSPTDALARFGTIPGRGGFPWCRFRVGSRRTDPRRTGSGADGDDR